MIDEKKLIKNLIPLLNEHGDMYFAGRIIGTIDSQPKIGEWIPCSERLPEMIGQDMQDLYPHVLVYAEEEDEWNIYVGIYGMYKPKEWVDAHDPAKIIENAIAWQPLPEPYKGREEVEDARNAKV